MILTIDSWVMIPPNPTPSQPFTPLPSEQILYSSPPRTSISISSLGKFPAQQPFSLSSSSGTLHLTSKRVVYLPSPSTVAFQSFASPHLNLQDSHITAPWIGPNVWTALLRPVQGGNLPSEHSALEVKVTFRDGGAYDFQSLYERVRERMVHAVELARERGQRVSVEGVEEGRGRGSGMMGVEVVMEDLPRYEEGGTHGAAPETRREEETATQETERRASVQRQQQEVFTPPDEPPPGYEQVQREVIEDEFSRRLNATRLERDGDGSP